MKILERDYGSPFVSKLKINTWGQRKALEFLPELSVSEGPMASFLVVKKKPLFTIKKPYALLWRKMNIVEYKSLKAPMNMHLLAKAHIYAHEVLCFGTKLEPVELEDLTVSIFRQTYPRKFFKECKKRGVTVEKKKPGVYVVKGFSCIPTQVVVLSLVEDPMLRSIVPGAKKEDIGRLLSFIEEERGDRFRKLGGDVLRLLQETNGETLMEMREEAQKNRNTREEKEITHLFLIQL